MMTQLSRMAASIRVPSGAGRAVERDLPEVVRCQERGGLAHRQQKHDEPDCGANQHRDSRDQ